MLPTPRPRWASTSVSELIRYGGIKAYVILEAAYSGRRSDHINGISANEINGVEANGTNGTTVKETNGTTRSGTEASQKDIMNIGFLKLAQASISKALLSDSTNSLCLKLIVLSASTMKALLSLAQNIGEWVKSHEMTPQALRNLS
jgi:hypothetical protein